MLDRSQPQPPTPASAADRLAQVAVLLAQLDTLLAETHTPSPPGLRKLLARLHTLLDAPLAPPLDAAYRAAAAQRWEDAPPWLEQPSSTRKQARQRTRDGR